MAWRQPIAGAGAVFTLAEGETRTIAPGAITDTYGNTNSQTITVTGSGVEAAPAHTAPTPAPPRLVCATAATPGADVPEAPWTPALVVLAMAMTGVVVRRARLARS